MRLGPGRASSPGRAPVARRDALRLGGLALGGLALAGCSDGPDPSPREGDLVLLDVADDDGAPLDLEGLRQIQSNGAGEDGWDDQLLDADTLRVVTHAPLEESEEATCQLRVPAGRACALTLSWPTSHGYSALVADIPGPGRHARPAPEDRGGAGGLRGRGGRTGPGARRGARPGGRRLRPTRPGPGGRRAGALRRPHRRDPRPAPR